MKGIPETSNSSWRLKYDRLRKDALNPSKDGDKPKYSNYESLGEGEKRVKLQQRSPSGKRLQKKPTIKPAGGAGAFRDPQKVKLRQQFNRKKNPKNLTRPKDTGIGGKKLGDRETGIPRGHGMKPSLEGRVQHIKDPQDQKDIGVKPHALRPERTVGSGVKREQDTSRRSPRGDWTNEDREKRQKFRKLRTAKRETDRTFDKLNRKRNRERLEQNVTRLARTKPVKPKPLDAKVDPSGDKNYHGSKGGVLSSSDMASRGLQSPDKIESTSGLINVEDKQPRGEGRGKPKMRGVSSRNVGDKDIKESVRAKPYKTTDQGGKQLRSQTVADELGIKEEPKKDKKEEDKENQSAKDRLANLKHRLLNARSEAEAKKLQEEISSKDEEGKEKKRELPPRVKLQRPTQAGTKFYFADQDKEDLEEDKRSEMASRAEQGTMSKEGMPKGIGSGKKDPKKEFGAKFGGRYPDSKSRSGVEREYRDLQQKLQGAKTDEEAKKYRKEIEDFKAGRKERESKQEKEAIAEQEKKQPKKPEWEEEYDKADSQRKQQKEKPKEDKEEKDNVDRTEQQDSQSSGITEEEQARVDRFRKTGKWGDVEESDEGKEYDVKQEKEEGEDETDHKLNAMVPKKTRTRTGRMSVGTPPTHYWKDGKKVKVPESLVHADRTGKQGKRTFYLAGTDSKTGVTAKEVFDNLRRTSERNVVTEDIPDEDFKRADQVGHKPKYSPTGTGKKDTQQMERELGRSGGKDESGKPKSTKTHSLYTINQLKEWLKDNDQTVDKDDKGAVDAKVREMRRSSKSLIDMNTQQLKLLKLTLK